ncbi:glycosyltransferase [Natranaerovirga pectinivora]|nr:glycosyltransferase [Natranaerovirga pectinivora]
MLERYSNIFEEVVVVSRQKEVESLENKLTLASTDRVTFIRVPDFKSARTYIKIAEAKTIVKKAVKNSDVVIARLPSSIGDLVVDAAIKNSKPYLIEVVACPWDAYWNHSIKGKLLAPFMYFSLKWKVIKSPYTIYVTNNFLQRRYPTKGKSTNCSNVALTEFDDQVLARRLGRIEGMPNNSKLTIGTTAAVNVKYKGQQYIIEALGQLKKQGIDNFEYQLVGGGEQKYLTKVAEKYDVVNQVKFIGVMPHNKVFEWLETVDLYVQPSRQEGLPRALIEAMSRGIPSFGARTAGIPELLDEKFIFSNTKDNIKQICTILKCFDKTVMKEQAIQNYNEALKYDKQIIEKRRYDFLEQLRNEIDVL